MASKNSPRSPDWNSKETKSRDECPRLSATCTKSSSLKWLPIVKGPGRNSFVPAVQNATDGGGYLDSAYASSFRTGGLNVGRGKDRLHSVEFDAQILMEDSIDGMILLYCRCWLLVVYILSYDTTFVVCRDPYSIKERHFRSHQIGKIKFAFC